MESKFFVAALAGVLAFQTAAAAFTVRLSNEGGRLTVPIHVNGQGPYKFMLDTGATTTMLGSQLAKSLTLSPKRTTPVKTFAGIVDIPVIRVESVSVGTYWSVGLDVLCADLSKFFGLDPGIQGILGQDVLSRLNYLLDSVSGKMVVEQAREIETQLSGTRIPFERWGGKPYILARAQNSDGVPLRVMLDSGIAYPVFYEDAGSRLEFLAPVVGAMATAQSTLGKRDLRSRVLRRLTIESFACERVTVYMTARLQSGSPEDGILPLSLFDSIYINNRDAFLVLNPRIVTDRAK